MIVILKKLNNTKDITLEFVDEIKADNIFYGITQSPESKDYMIVLYNKCKKCNIICNSIHFQQNFNNWTSGNYEIDEFIQYTQLSSHKDLRKALEWIPYDKFYNIKYIAENEYKAKWIDGNIFAWDIKNKNWKRENQYMIVILKKLSNPNGSKLMDEIKADNIFYGITQSPESKDYMMVLYNKCKKCNIICNSIHFKQNFNNWTSGNYEIDEFIQYTQLSSHKDLRKALEWIPHEKFYNIKYIVKNEYYEADWSDEKLLYWDHNDQKWKRSIRNIIVVLKKLSNPNCSKLMDEV
ncbi:hypothetical protein C1646_667568 [Rhizophagus diaphanus]|nr:hypothetical protein C1646_667568 [Rhizophagus diaphanus] [Rhizophagus sp. MUCL 43196]